MDEKKRIELVQAINQIRKEIGLKEYNLAYLENKSTEELEKLYAAYFKLREDYLKKLKESKQFKFNFKTGLLIGAVVMVVSLTLLLTQNFIMVRETEKIFLGKEYKFTVGYISNVGQNLSLFTLANLGNTTIRNFIIKVDNQETNYHITKGSLPLAYGQSIEFTIFDVCDKEHIIEVIIDNQREIIIVNPSICGEKVG